ncbi:MAG: ISAs1 family transposase [Gemmataceae bacterium]
MSSAVSTSLLAAFQQLSDPRHRRGIRHPFPGLLAVIFLGLLSRHADFASLARWAKRHWPVLKDAFGLTRRYAPHATTYSRVAANFSVDEFRSAVAGWFAHMMTVAPAVAAVDGKTSKQANDDDGDPIHVLNVFAHEAKVCLADWPVGDGKDTEPEVLKAHLDELFTTWPSLRVLTGDALFCQRPLARVIIDAGRDYVLAVKDNQPDLHETVQTAFATATPDTADAVAREKNVVRSRRDAFGATRKRPTTHGRR